MFDIVTINRRPWNVVNYNVTDYGNAFPGAGLYQHSAADCANALYSKFPSNYESFTNRK